MGCGASSAYGVGAPEAGAEVLQYYDLKVLGPEREKRVYGPFTKLCSYNSKTHEYKVSILVVKHVIKGITKVTAAGHPRLHWSVDGVPGSEVHADKLDKWHGYKFYRFVLTVKLADTPKKLTYTVWPLTPGSAWEIALPGAHDPWHWAFYSCNGLHDPKDAVETRGVQPLWRDVMQQHKDNPFHVMIGGGDQLYNDGVWNGPHIKGWDQAADSGAMKKKINKPFNEELKHEVEEFYFSHYCQHFTQPVYRDALACIPSINAWDDHDIFDGWGSYPTELQNSSIMQGVYTAARRFYLLFQLHTTEQLLKPDGYWPGPSANTIVQLGDSTAVVMTDTRSERNIDQIMPEHVYGELEKRMRALPQSVKHVVVVMGVPILYPSIPVQETIQALTDLAGGQSLMSLFMQKTGLASLLTDRFGQVEVLDDIIDHWDSKQHGEEREKMIRMLMNYSKSSGARVTCIAGDVHCAGVGIFNTRQSGSHRFSYSSEDTESSDDERPNTAILARDPCFIPQIISSAIGNIPPPTMVLRALESYAQEPERVLSTCESRMINMFGPKGQVGSILHGRRNWCEVSTAADGSELQFSLRCEKELGSSDVDVYSYKVPSQQIAWSDTSVSP